MDAEKDYMIYCPMFKKKIEDGLCYDINAVLKREMIPEGLSEFKDWNRARKCCPDCKVTAYP